MWRYFISFLLAASFCFSQSPKDSLVLYHNGKTASRFQFRTGDTILQLGYFKNGRLKDSVWLHLEVMIGYRNSSDSIVVRNYTPFGTEKKFYKNGALSAMILHSSDSLPTSSYSFRKNGGCSAYREAPYGLDIHYTKKGKAAKYADFNKKGYVSVPKEFRQSDHLKGSGWDVRIKTKETVLVSGERSLKLKAGAMMSVRLNNDTTVRRHCLIEGFSGDSICISFFGYDLSASKDRLKHLGTGMIAMNELQSIFYSRKDPRAAYRAASIVEFIGFDMVLVPLAVVPIFAGGVYLANPFVLSTMVAGIPVFIWSKSLFRKLSPREYKLSEWKLKG